ncbi:hypothetical protein NRI82_004344 [Vibrio vulnificus]|nr:hypothetical protein [Vibrio vulnificus]EJO3996209.1 hypothetical protein [Vibrio vulnificus]
MRYLKFLFVVILLVVLVRIIFWYKESSNNIQLLKSFDSSMPYAISEVDSRRFNLPQKGEFGAMSSCIKKFRSKSARRIKDADGGNSGLLRVFSGNYKILLSIYSDEAYSIRLFKFDDSGDYIWQTSSYSINCDVKLMNTIEYGE